MMRNSPYYGMTYAQRQEHRARRKIEIAAEKVKKQATAKTCQCCARQIFAEVGTIAHHGYERPGHGYQTASCMGAKFLPFEASRDRLGEMIVMLKDMKARYVEVRAEAAAEKFPIRKTYVNYNAPRVMEHGTWGDKKHPTVELEFTRENFATLVEQNTGDHGSHKLWTAYEATSVKKGGFNKLKTDDLATRDRQIKGVTEHIAECEKRYAGWKQTHRWTNDGWVTI